MIKGSHHTEETKEKISREKNCNWGGGITERSKGYVRFKIPKGCRFSSMVDKEGYVLIHRLIMAEYLQRPLDDEEIIHHINGNINDNKIENLKLMNQSEHTILHWNIRKKKKIRMGEHFNGRFKW